LAFVQEFEQREHPVDIPWIEGCVYMDVDQRILLFWEEEQLYPSTIKTAYLELLRQIWKGWNVRCATRHMYDIEALSGIPYTAHQPSKFQRMTLDEFKSSPRKDYLRSIAVLKKEGKVFLKQVYEAEADTVARVGVSVVEALLQIPDVQFLKEEDCESSLLVLDLDRKILYVDAPLIVIGLQEQLTDWWPGWQIEVGDFGYLPLLEKIGVDPTPLRPSTASIEAALREIVDIKDNFDPQLIAQSIVKDGAQARFHANFFENIKRKPTTWQQIKSFFKK
jgi:hypothetical protein